ncbi:MAG TPA: hypothetical protein VNO21_06765 [Polyangiaceae bacterium]|nr:hypothetical protein [Polyangiaceae bacterium]
MKRHLWILLCSSFLFAPPAHAANDPPGAQALFNEAKKLMTAGRWADACPKLEESQRLDPGIGTEFNLANCYEHTARSATAWATFLNVAGEAKAAGQSAREKVARDRAQALEPKLSKLIISVRAADVAGLKVTRDAVEIGRTQWGTPIPIDAGEHRIAVSAPGKRSWEKSVHVAVDGLTVNVEIPALQDDPTARDAPPATGASAAEGSPANGGEGTNEEHPGRTQRTIGVVTAAVGIVGIGAGTVFGFMSRSKRDDANNGHCNADNRCDDTGLQLRDDALHDGTFSTIAFAAGGAALVGGIVLFATAPKAPSAQNARSPHPTWQAAPMVGGGATGIRVLGRW